MLSECGKIVEKGIGKNVGHYECVPVRFPIARYSIFFACTTTTLTELSNFTFVEDVNTRKPVFSFSFCVLNCKNQLLKKSLVFDKLKKLE